MTQKSTQREWVKICDMFIELNTTQQYPNYLHTQHGMNLKNTMLNKNVYAVSFHLYEIQDQVTANYLQK